MSYNLRCKKHQIELVLFNNSSDTIKLIGLEWPYQRKGLIKNNGYTINKDTLIVFCIDPTLSLIELSESMNGAFTIDYNGGHIGAGIAPKKYYRMKLKITDACKPSPVNYLKFVSSELVPPMVKDETLRINGKENWETTY